MTKQRAPLTFADAITRVAGVIGFARCAEIADRSERAVRYWSEPDSDHMCSLDQALALDLAYVAAGGEGWPILESYALQAQTTLAETLADHAALARDIATLAVESADAIAHSISVTRPGAQPGEVHRAIAETEEACGAVTRLIGRLKSFLPGKSAGSGRPGGNLS